MLDTLLGFSTFPTSSPNVMKIDRIPAENKLFKDHTSSQNTLPGKAT